MKIMKQIKIFVIAICTFCGLLSCSDMLETDSERQVFDPALNQKSDSIYYALGVLQGMQELADQYFFQGEMRGDLVQTTIYTDKNLRQLADFSATTANKYDSAYVYYRVINNCNYYIAHRDTTLRTGATLVVMPEYIAIKAIRAWAYLQLARTYGKVPFYTTPLTKISEIDADYEQLDMKGIVDRLAPDLEQYSGMSTADFGNVTPQNSAFYTSKVYVPVDVILGDMYLETGNYEKAASHYVTYLTKVATNRFSALIEPYSNSMRSFGRGRSPLELPGDWSASNTTVLTNFHGRRLLGSFIDYVVGGIQHLLH